MVATAAATAPNSGSSVPRRWGYHERDRSTEELRVVGQCRAGHSGWPDGTAETTRSRSSAAWTGLPTRDLPASGREAAARLARTCPRRGGEFILDEDALPRLPEGSRLMINRIDKPIGQRRLDVQA